MPGVPKREDQRRRRNKPTTPVTKARGAANVPIPAADADWHPIAAAWYASLPVSGQSVFYEPSDWATAHFVAEGMSRNLTGGRFSADLFRSVLAGASSLMVTEGDRRRLRIELDRQVADPDEDAAATALDDYRDRLTG